MMFENNGHIHVHRPGPGVNKPPPGLSLYEPHREKPAFCMCENKDADQLRSDFEADQRLCFRYTDSTIPLLPKSEISSL